MHISHHDLGAGMGNWQYEMVWGKCRIVRRPWQGHLHTLLTEVKLGNESNDKRSIIVRTRGEGWGCRTLIRPLGDIGVGPVTLDKPEGPCDAVFKHCWWTPDEICSLAWPAVMTIALPLCLRHTQHLKVLSGSLRNSGRGKEKIWGQSEINKKRTCRFKIIFTRVSAPRSHLTLLRWWARSLIDWAPITCFPPLINCSFDFMHHGPHSMHKFLYTTPFCSKLCFIFSFIGGWCPSPPGQFRSGKQNMHTQSTLTKFFQPAHRVVHLSSSRVFISSPNYLDCPHTIRASANQESEWGAAPPSTYHLSMSPSVNTSTLTACHRLALYQYRSFPSLQPSIRHLLRPGCHLLPKFSNGWFFAYEMKARPTGNGVLRFFGWHSSPHILVFLLGSGHFGIHKSQWLARSSRGNLLRMTSKRPLGERSSSSAKIWRWSGARSCGRSFVPSFESCILTQSKLSKLWVRYKSIPIVVYFVPLYSW